MLLYKHSFVYQRWVRSVSINNYFYTELEKVYHDYSSRNLYNRASQNPRVLNSRMVFLCLCVNQISYLKKLALPRRIILAIASDHDCIEICIRRTKFYRDPICGPTVGFLVLDVIGYQYQNPIECHHIISPVSTINLKF